MKSAALLLVAILPPLGAAGDGLTALFNGTDLTGWTVNENEHTFSVKDGAIMVKGSRSHCFYTGEFQNHQFTDFELQMEVKTLPDSNSGIYFHTEFQDSGWPAKGFEVQVNSFKEDPAKTGSLYQVQNAGSLHNDNEWFTLNVMVKGNTVRVKVNGRQAVKWTQPAGWKGSRQFPERRIGSGTIALQGHDPDGTVYYRNIRIRPLG